VTATYATCVAEALISVVTVFGLKASGTSVADLREGFGAEQNDLPDKLYDSMADETRQAFGAAVQKCGFGPVMAPDFVRNIQGTRSSDGTATHAKCLADELGLSQHRRLVAALRLVAYLRDREALEFAEILVPCIDWSASIQTFLEITLAGSERACINRTARSEPALAQKLARQFTGDDYAGQDFRKRLERSCLSPEHARTATRIEASQG
jgi:hypothetical protein